MGGIPAGGIVGGMSVGGIIGGIPVPVGDTIELSEPKVLSGTICDRATPPETVRKPNVSKMGAIAC